MTMEATIKELQNAWAMLFPNVDAPAERQWAVWLMTYDAELVKRSIAKVAVRYYRSPQEFRAAESLHKFASTIMRRLGTQQTVPVRDGR